MKRFLLFALSTLVFLAFAKAEKLPTISIVYDGATATVDIPSTVTGVTSKITGANVTLTNKNVTDEYCFKVSGTSTDGSLVINSTEFKVTLELAGVNLTSTKGAAIDVECKKRIAVVLAKGTENTLVDKQGGAQKAALYFAGHPEFEGAGTLNVTGRAKHAISSKEYLQLKKNVGTINVLGAASDGIHCGKSETDPEKIENNYFTMKGGTVNIQNVGGDCIDSDDLGYVDISGGTLNYTVSADGGRGIKCDVDFTMSGGTINATLEGGILVKADDTDRCMAVNVSGDMMVSGGTINVCKVNKEAKSYKVKGAFSVTDAGLISVTGSEYSVNPKDFLCDMTVYAQLVVDGYVPADYANYQIGAFVGNECRGAAEIITIAGNNTYAYLRVYGNDGEKVTFKVLDSGIGATFAANEFVAFADQKSVGTPSSPKNLTITTVVPGDLNYDGKVTIADLALLISYLNNENPSISKKAADVDADGNINLNDLKAMLEIIQGE